MFSTESRRDFGVFAVIFPGESDWSGENHLDHHLPFGLGNLDSEFGKENFVILRA
jgi:hypothetical protein